MTSPTTKPSWRIVVILAMTMSVGGAAATLASFAARLHWALDLTTHWPVQLALGSLLPTGLLLAVKRWKLAILPALVVIINASIVLPVYMPAKASPANGPSLRLLSVNVHTANTQTDLLIDLVKREQPDVVVLMEINRRWERDLQPLLADYPHHLIAPREDNFGIALLSRHPLLEKKAEHLGESDVPTIFAQLEVDSQRVRVIATHPLPPVSGEFARLRDAQLRELGQRVVQMNEPVILAGDLNVTLWSPVFRDLLRTSSLRDSRQGFGVHATWPTGGGLLCIPIDHVLASQTIHVKNMHIGSDIGSDHLPILAELILPAP